MDCKKKKEEIKIFFEKKQLYLLSTPLFLNQKKRNRNQLLILDCA